MRSKWPWVAWRRETEVDKAKEVSQANSVDRILQKQSTENSSEPDRCSEFHLAATTMHGFMLAAVNFIAKSTLYDSRLI